MKVEPNDVIDALVEMIATRVAAKLAAPSNTGTTWSPLADVAARLGWTPRHLKTFCAQHGLAVAGTRKHPLVDAATVNDAIAGTRRATRTPAAPDRVASLVRRRMGGA